MAPTKNASALPAPIFLAHELGADRVAQHVGRSIDFGVERTPKRHA